MAVAASTIDTTCNRVPLELLTSIIRKTCAKYNWDKKDSTYKTFQKHLKSFADDANVSLEDMAVSSTAYARDIDYSIIPKFNWWNVPELNQRFQNIPYIIHVGDDNITSVLIKSGNVDCPIKEITTDMMQLLRYLGIIRVYVVSNLYIPCWTDNIVYMQITKTNVISHINEMRIPFPKYLQELVDTTKFAGAYTNWLPLTITTLITACTQLQNLGSNLKNFTYTGRDSDAVITQSDFLPIGLRKVIYLNRSTAQIANEITMPPGTQYLMIGFERIYNTKLYIRNVKHLFITDFRLFIYSIDDDISTSNLTLEYQSTNETVYRQNVEIILEDGLEELTIDIAIADLKILECIKQVPPSLKQISIVNVSMMVDKHSFIDIDISTYNKVKLYEEDEKILKNFNDRFPHICLSTS